MNEICFYDKQDFPQLKLVEEKVNLIQNELNNLLQIKSMQSSFQKSFMNTYPDYIENIMDKDAWKIFTLLFFGIKDLENRKLCPELTKILDQIPELITAQFSILEPQTQIKPHKGYSKLVLRCHLPLLVPTGNKCGIRVGNETRCWKEGELLIFDDSIEHEAWNNSDEVRVVLMFDIAKPDCGYSAKEICDYKIKNIDDPFLLALAPKEDWIKSMERGYFTIL